jgi:hypothetical protein
MGPATIFYPTIPHASVGPIPHATNQHTGIRSADACSRGNAFLRLRRLVPPLLSPNVATATVRRSCGGRDPVSGYHGFHVAGGEGLSGSGTPRCARSRGRCTLRRGGSTRQQVQRRRAARRRQSPVWLLTAEHRWERRCVIEGHQERPFTMQEIRCSIHEHLLDRRRLGLRRRASRVPAICVVKQGREK